MRGIVHIFGGLRTKSTHFRHAMEIYRKYDFDIHFVEAPFISSLVPTQYQKHVGRVLNSDLLTHEATRRVPKIIHTSSGGLWSGLELNAKCPHDCFVMEAGPLSCYNLGQFALLCQRNYRIPIGLSYGLMRVAGIPLIQHNPSWFANYEHQITQLGHTTIINGDKDEYLDREYIDHFILQQQERGIAVRCVNIKEATHFRIAKANIAQYQNAIEAACIRAIGAINEPEHAEAPIYSAGRSKL